MRFKHLNLLRLLIREQRFIQCLSLGLLSSSFFVWLSDFLTVSLPVYVTISVCLLSVCLSAFLSPCLSACPFVCLPAYLSGTESFFHWQMAHYNENISRNDSDPMTLTRRPQPDSDVRPYPPSPQPASVPETLLTSAPDPVFLRIINLSSMRCCAHIIRNHRVLINFKLIIWCHLHWIKNPKV